MNVKLKKQVGFSAPKKTTVFLLSVVFFFVSASAEVFAQKKFSKTYPASKNVRLQLTNRTGTVTVEGWDRDEVKISADMEAPAANMEPRSLSGTIDINLVKDNQGRGEVGNVNFTIKVPYDSSVDIETRMGNLNVSNVRGTLVRAHISSEGDIVLTSPSPKTGSRVRTTLAENPTAASTRLQGKNPGAIQSKGTREDAGSAMSNAMGR